MIAFASTPFCAVCTREVANGGFVFEPLGLRGADVVVCQSCCGEEARPPKHDAPRSKPKRKAARERANRAARMAYETGCSIELAAREHDASRTLAYEVYRELYPLNPLRRGRERKAA